MSDSPTSHYAGVHEQLVDLQDRYVALERELAEARKAALSEGIRSGEAEAEVERLKNELERQGQQDTHISTLMRENTALRQRHAKIREALHTIIAERARNLAATCPGEHEYEPYCTHGVDNCPIIATAKSALEASHD